MVRARRWTFLIFSLKGPSAELTERFAMDFPALAASTDVLVTSAAGSGSSAGALVAITKDSNLVIAWTGEHFVEGRCIG